jgi:hypothetical protein
MTLPHSVAVNELAYHWKERARDLRAFAAEQQATVFDYCRKQLEAALEERANEVLSLRQAANESGYSPDHLGRLLRDGTIQNAGRKYSPKVRRCDLPMKRALRLEAAAASVRRSKRQTALTALGSEQREQRDHG